MAVEVLGHNYLAKAIIKKERYLFFCNYSAREESGHEDTKAHFFSSSLSGKIHSSNQQLLFFTYHFR